MRRFPPHKTHRSLHFSLSSISYTSQARTLRAASRLHRLPRHGFPLGASPRTSPACTRTKSRARNKTRRTSASRSDYGASSLWCGEEVNRPNVILVLTSDVSPQPKIFSIESSRAKMKECCVRGKTTAPDFSLPRSPRTIFSERARDFTFG